MTNNSLSAWMDGMQKGLDNALLEREAFFKALGEPNTIIPAPTDDPDEEHKSEYGYWRVKNGILRFRRFVGKQWDLYSRQEYSASEIELLVVLMCLPENVNEKNST